MKAVMIEKPWDIKNVERDIPEIKDGEALIKVKAVGICGSDIGAFRGSNNLVSYPRVIGHEIAGEIVAIKGDNPKNFAVGDSVVSTAATVTPAPSAGRTAAKTYMYLEST